jgi:proteic killer suppression protein
MDVEFASEELRRLEVDPTFGGGWDAAIVRGFRKVMQAIRAAADERDLYALRGLRFEKLKGQRKHQHSLRLNQQWRLIVELRGDGPQKRMRIVEVVDYH